jgi:hypothetical protein
MNAIAQDASKAESELGSVPANVQQAFRQVNSFFSQAKAAIAGDTSISQFGPSLAALDTGPLRAASMTLTQYAETHCGFTTTTTTAP